MTFDDLSRMLEMFLATLETWKESGREQITGTMPGTHSLNDVEFMVWWGGMVEQFPPEPWLLPDGSATVIASPWVMALPLTEDGRTESARYNRIMEQAFGGRMAEPMPTMVTA